MAWLNETDNKIQYRLNHKTQVHMHTSKKKTHMGIYLMAHKSNLHVHVKLQVLYV